jgi:hypothetical protein
MQHLSLVLLSNVVLALARQNGCLPLQPLPSA